MAGGHKPRSGSLAFYPKKRAAREIPSFSTYPSIEEENSKPLNFYGYKAGMLHVIAKNAQPKSTTYNQNISVPATVIECPPLKVYGVRAYRKTHYGPETAFDIYHEKVSTELRKRIPNFLQPQKKDKGKDKKGGEKKEEKKGEKEKKVEAPKTASRTISDLEKEKENIITLKLLAYSQPRMTGIGKHKPEVFELGLSGDLDKQITFAKDKFGEQIRIGEVVSEKQFVDVKAVDRGKGFSGPVKRFGIKTHRPKAKKARVVGSIGPWTPGTVMWTVARPGQLGYQTRTEYNKRVLKIGENAEEINPASGFTNFGNVKNDYVILAGSVPGPAKRIVGIRAAIRTAAESKHNVSDISYISTSEVKKPVKVVKETVAEKVEEKKEVKSEKHSEKKEDVKEKKVKEKPADKKGSKIQKKRGKI